MLPTTQHAQSMFCGAKHAAEQAVDNSRSFRPSFSVCVIHLTQVHRSLADGEYGLCLHFKGRQVAACQHAHE